jgi:acetylornithine/N-succinyldiaminopimelate aminotransferase
VAASRVFQRRRHSFDLPAKETDVTPVTTQQNAHLMQFSPRPPPVMVHGEGSYLWDAQGRRYLDFVQGWAVNCLGHSPPALLRALEAQAHAVLNVGPAYHNQPALTLAARLAQHSKLGRVFFACSGAEANEAAVKLARKWGQKHKRGAYEVISTRDGFHGRTLAMTCATGKAGFDTAFPPAVPGFKKAAYGDVEALEQAVTDHTVAVLVEPIQGEAGVVVPPAGYLAALRALCDRHGLLLICDEIQTGMARTGPLFAHQSEGVLPDIMTLGKGLGGGLPLSALLCREDVACFEAGDHGGTFAGHTLLCAAGNAVLEALCEPVQAARRARHALELERGLCALAARHGLGVRGRGFLWALVLDADLAPALRDRAFDHGLLINAARPNVLRLMPALNVGSAEIAAMLATLSAVLDAAPRAAAGV